MITKKEADQDRKEKEEKSFIKRIYINRTEPFPNPLKQNIDTPEMRK
jgi:hypothetical protein